MNELVLFAGAGGGILASLLLKWRTICAVEISEHCRAVLTQRQEEGILRPFPIWDDIKTFDGTKWRGAVDVVSCGFPCQPFSTASHQRKTAENLWPEARRVFREITPPLVFAENVSKKAINEAAKDLCSMGYTCLAMEVGADDVGGDHIRKRFWLLAYTDDEGQLLCKHYAEVASVSKLQACVWATGPNRRRVDDGVSARMDRYKATGNGQVPQVAATAFMALTVEAAER